MTISQETINELSEQIEGTIQEQVATQVGMVAPAAFLGILATLMRNMIEVEGKLQCVLSEETLNILADMIYPGVNSLGYHIESQNETDGIQLRLVPLSSAAEEEVTADA